MSLNSAAMSCLQCEYKCKLNIQMKKHIRADHMEVAEKRFKCNWCDFQSDGVITLNKHNLNQHPESQMDSKSKTVNVSESILNLLAEQNLDMMEEVINLKRDWKGAIEQLAGDIKECFDGLTEETKEKDKAIKATLANITDKT